MEEVRALRRDDFSFNVMISDGSIVCKRVAFRNVLCGSASLVGG